VGAPQAFHFKQLFKILEVMGYDWGSKCEHIPFGIVQSETGSTFSTRDGNVKFLNDILDEAQSKSLELMKKDEAKFAQILDVETTSDVVGISGVLLQDLGAKHMKDYKFSWDRMLQEHGNTGPYLQYQHVRLASIKRKCGFEENSDADLSLLTEPCAKILAMRIGELPSKLLFAAEKKEAVVLVDYLFDLTRTISSAYEQLSVKVDHTKDLKLSEARLALFM
jgi:arginyl-tRNA synthetase